MPANLEAFGLLGSVSQECDLSLQFTRCILGVPLKRRLGFGDKSSHRRRNRHVLVILLANFHASFSQLCNSEDVFITLSGKSNQKVQLDPTPPLAKCGINRCEEVVVRDQLIDHFAHSPGAALWGKGEACALHLLNLRCGRHSKGVNSKRRQTHRNLATIVWVINHIGNNTFNPRKIGTRERR